MMKTDKRNLPDGWRWVALGSICELNPRRVPNLSRDDSAPTTFVPMSAVDEQSGTIARPETKAFSEVCKGYTYFEEGDILFAKITPCMQNGKHAIARKLVSGFAFGSTEFHVIRPSQEITAEWVHLFVRQPAVLKRATEHFTGAVGQQRVPESYLASLEIPLPPLDEQRRIAAILSEQLAAVERARVAAEAQLEAAEALPSAYLREVFESEEARGWERKKLGEFLLETRNGIYKPDVFYGTGTPILKMFNIGRLDGSWNLDRVDRIQLTDAEFETYAFRVGDIMINRVNSRELVGKCAVVDEQTAAAVFESKNMRLRVDTDKLDPWYVAIYLNSVGTRRQIESKLRQIVGQATVNRSDIDSLELPVPPLPEQQRITGMIHKQIASLEITRQALQAQMDGINQLPSALLRQAFSGEL